MVPGDCFLCRKHRGEEAQPPGGYILEEEHWLICHAPVSKGPLGTLFIESRRHVLDFSEFSEAECATFGAVLRGTYSALRNRLRPQRIYQLSMMEGIPHFHAWIIPRLGVDVERGIAHLAADRACSESEASDLAGLLRTDMGIP